MNNLIEGSEHPLSEIFSSSFEFHIPHYQRPYAWTTEESSTLFDDLLNFYNENTDESYFLGSIVLVKSKNSPHADVVDGQQRLTTLSILIAALASQFTDDELIMDYSDYLREAGRKSQGLIAKPRLFLRDKDQPFFEKYVQGARVTELATIDPATLPNEAQVNISANAQAFLRLIIEAFKGDESALSDFGKFVMTRCYIVAVATPTQSSAYRVFSVLNSRGLDLLPTDIIKAQILAALDESLRGEYTEKWEDLETKVTRDGFGEAFSHIRMIYAKKKSRKNLSDEFQDYVMSRYLHNGCIDAQKLIDQAIAPYAEAYATLIDASLSFSSGAEEANEYLGWLNRLDNSDWLPAAMSFLVKHSNNGEYVAWFLKKLERLSAFMYATSMSVNRRIDRYGMILKEMEELQDDSLENPIISIELTPDEKRDFVEALDGNIYRKTPRKRNYIILRLDAFVSDQAAVYNLKRLTLEHVLPQTVKPGSNWERTWPDAEERAVWRDRIANLVPLTRSKNSQAQNYDFEVKKEKYFRGKDGVSSYALTTKVLETAEWTPDVVKARQEELMRCFIANWELG